MSMDAKSLDVDALFQQFPIKELRVIETNIKGEIEKKKEELRVMVYNRYRDIIDAADAIHVMKDCSKKLESIVNDLQHSEIFQRNFFTFDKINTIDKNTTYFIKDTKYVLAVIIKILQNSPSKIWYHLDHNEFLNAAVQYLFAQHVHVVLDLEKSLKEEPESIVYINYGRDLWNSIVFLKNTIVNKAKHIFEQTNLTTEVLINSIIAITLLEKTPLKDLFKEYLNCRIPTIRSILINNSISENSNINDRIIDALTAFTSTVSHIYEIFYADSAYKNPELNVQLKYSFEETLNSNISTVEMLKDDGFVVHKIPTFLKNFNYKDLKIESLDLSFVISSCKEWFQKCTAEIKEEIASVFKYTKNLKSLAFIRDSVMEFIEKTQLNNDNEWKRICSELFQVEFNIWNELIAAAYNEKSKQILAHYFQDMHDNLMKNFNESMNLLENPSNPLNEFELDVSSFLWSEIDNEINIKIFETRSVDPKAAKTKSVTPTMQRLYKIVNDDILKIIEDLEATNKGLTSKLENSANLGEHLKDNTLSFQEKLLNTLDSTAIDLKNKLNDNTYNLQKLIFIARFLSSFHNSCSQLSYIHLRRMDSKRRINTTPTLDNKTNIGSEDLSLNFINKLNELSVKICKIWIENVCEKLQKKYITSKSPFDVKDSLFDGLLAWSEIEIEEEIEMENKSKVKISVPMTYSPIIQNLLYEVSQMVVKSLTYTMINSVAKEIQRSIFKMVISFYRQKINHANEIKDNDKFGKFLLTQNHALQMIFDIKYLNMLFDLKMDTELNQEYKSLYNDLEAIVDPFDFDILTPFIDSNVNKAVAKSGSLFGVLNLSERFSRNSKKETIATDFHNFLLLSNNTQRFELLPISTTTANRNAAKLSSLDSSLDRHVDGLATMTNKGEKSGLNKLHSTSERNVSQKDYSMSSLVKWFQQK